VPELADLALKADLMGESTDGCDDKAQEDRQQNHERQREAARLPIEKANDHRIRVLDREDQRCRPQNPDDDIQE
jgi:hypothetical protein